MTSSSPRGLRIAALSSLLAALLLATLSAFASPSFASPAAQGVPQSVTVPAGGTATIKVRGFCLAFGKPFPTSATSLNALAPDNVRQALYYAIQKGYTDNNAAQVQEAVWYLQDNTWHNNDHTVGQEIVTNAASVSAISTGSGIAITEPTLQSSVTFTATFVPQTADAFYGDGDLVITNKGTTAFQVYVPIGAKFTVPGSNGQFQDLIAYALQPAGGTPTAAATVAATGTTAAAATNTTAPTAQASSTTAPTSTVAVETATTAPTSTIAVETPTSAPTATSMPMATATTEVVAPLPTTGSSEDNLSLLLAVGAIAFALVGAGLLMRSRVNAR